MRFLLVGKALGQYTEFPARLQTRVDKQLHYLLDDIRHPSLDAKKYDERRDIWQARVTRDYRMYFRIVGDTYKILFITKHPK